MCRIMDHSSMYDLWRELSKCRRSCMMIAFKGEAPDFVVPHLIRQTTWRPLAEYEFVAEYGRHKLGDVESYAVSVALRPL